MLQFIRFSSPVPSGLAGNGITRRTSSAHAADTGGAHPPRMRRRKGFGIHLLLAAVTLSLSGIAATANARSFYSSTPVDPGYEFELVTNSQRFATETFNGELARFTRLQPNRPGAMQVRLRLVSGYIGSFRYNNRPAPMAANIEFCLQNGAQFGRNLRDGGRAARDNNNGPTVRRDGRDVEVLRYGDFEFVNADRDGDNIDIRILRGGREYHSCVTVRVEIHSTNNVFIYAQHTIEPGDEIVFNVPSIRNAHALADPARPIDVRVRMAEAVFDERGSSSFGVRFAETYRFRGDDVVRRTDIRYEDGVRITEVEYTPLGEVRDGRRHIAHSSPALLLELGRVESRTVHDTNLRRFHGESGAASTTQARLAPLATVTLREIGGIQYASNGIRDFRLRDPHSDRHRLRVTVNGPFTDGDHLFLDYNGNSRQEPWENFSFNEDRTVATGVFNILDSIVDRPVYFFASLDHDINPGDYRVEATYDFDFRSYRDLVSSPVTTRINGSASSLELRQTASAAVYATEVFGEGSDETVLEARGMSTTLVAQDIAGGSRHRLRFELEAPAVFGEDIQSSHLRTTNNLARIVPGTGTAGSSSAEFTLDNSLGAVIAGTRFTFNIPSIRNAEALAEAGGTINVSASMARNDDEFSDETIGVDSTAVATSAPGFVFNLTMGDMAVIDPANPAMLLGEPNVDTDSDGVNDTKALMLGTLVLHRSEGEQHDHDGGDIPIRDVDEVILTVPDLSASEGDRIFIDLDGDMHIGLGESFALVDEDHEDFPAAALTLSGPDATTDSDGAHVYYVAADSVDFSPATYTLTADYEFGRTDGEAENYQALVISTESTITDEVDEMIDVDLDSLDEAGLVDNIPGSGEGNNTVIRIINMRSTPVTVYVQAADENGAGIGRSVAVIEITGNGSTSLTPERTDELFCGQADAACWSGNASFRFFTSPDADIIVRTHLIDIGDDSDDGNNQTGFADIF